MTDRPSIVPYFSDADAKAAIRFLTEAFGFAVIQSYDTAEGVLQHAELRFGNGVIMLGSEARAKGSPGVYLVVGDVDAHYARAREAGADIVHPPEDTQWGTRRYRATDPEGHEWSFGSYQPQTTAPEWA